MHFTRFARRHATTACALALLTTTACGKGVTTPHDFVPQPVFTATAHITGSLTAAPAHARGEVRWSRLGSGLDACLQGIHLDHQVDTSGTTSLTDDELTFLRCLAAHPNEGSVVGTSVAFTSSFPASFALPLDDVPPVDALSGAAGAGFSVGTVLVYDDVNSDGALDVQATGASTPVDVILGSSGDPWGVQEQDRIVYREGDLPPAWNVMVGLFNCGDEPPLGFSILHMTTFDGQPESCAVLTDPTLSVALSNDPHLQEFACDAPTLPAFARSTEPLPLGADVVCLSSTTLLFSTDPHDACPAYQKLTLVGCDDPSSFDACQTSAYFDTDPMPTWWPCAGDQVSLVNVQSDFTDDDDRLFSLQYTGGVEHLDLARLSVALVVRDQTVTIPLAPGALHDNDGDGTLSMGDILDVTEPSNLFTAARHNGLFSWRLLAHNDDGSSSEIGAGIFHIGTPPTPVALALHAVDDDAPLTVGADIIAHVSYDVDANSTQPVLALADLVVTVDSGNSFDHLMDVSLDVDVNGDGAFGPGDSLLLRERAADGGLDENNQRAATVNVEALTDLAMPFAQGAASVVLQ